MNVKPSVLSLLGWAIAFLAPIKPFLVAVGALIFIDLVFGIWSAYKRGEPISSKGLRRTVTKIVAYQSAIITAFILEKYFLDFLPVVKIVGGFVAVTEAKSIYENLGTITGLDFWSLIKERLNSQSNKFEEPSNGKDP